MQNIQFTNKWDKRRTYLKLSDSYRNPSYSQIHGLKYDIKEQNEYYEARLKKQKS